MAAIVRLLGEVPGMVIEICDKRDQVELLRSVEYYAAVKIQSWFRGLRVRAYLKYLSSCATLIQKIWRGFLGRRYYRILLKSTVFIMKINRYNHMASKIQKVWRGYFVRKYVFNFYGRQRYLEALQVKNEMIRSELAEYAEQQAAARKQEEEKNERMQKEYEARKHHYLLSTEVMPGIYNSPFLLCPTETEYLMRSVCPLTHKKKKANEPDFDPACMHYNPKVPKTLPPLPSKPQGPFREPEDVQKQRYKPFKPTLRVCTDFYSLEKAREKLKEEEWVTRINDNIFRPFTHTGTFYESLLHTTTKFGHIPYGTEYFREESVDKNISLQKFKTVVPPIPVFEKLNDTYSRGEV